MIGRVCRASLAGATFATFIGIALSVSACSEPEPKEVIEYDAYEGDAYPNLRKPITIPAEGAGFISNSYSDTVSVIDLGTAEVMGNYPVGRDPVTLDGPHHVAVSPSADAIYVALSYPVVSVTGPHASHGSSVRSGYAQKLSGVDLSIVGQVRVDNNPGDVVVSEDGKRLVTSHFDLQKALKNPTNIDAARATLAVMDTSQMFLSGSPAAVRIPTCVAPHGIVLSRPDGATAFVACYGEDSLAFVDIVGGKVTSRVPMGSNAEGFGDPQYGPYSIVLSPDGAKLAIGNTVSNDVRFVDTKTLELLTDQTLTTLGSPYFPVFTPDGKFLFVPTQSPDAVTLFDLETLTVVEEREFVGEECPLPHVATLLQDGSFALVCEGDHTLPGKVIWLDPETLETKKEVNVGIYPDALVPFWKGGGK